MCECAKQKQNATKEQPFRPDGGMIQKALLFQTPVRRREKTVIDKLSERAKHATNTCVTLCVSMSDLALLRTKAGSSHVVLLSLDHRLSLAPGTQNLAHDALEDLPLGKGDLLERHALAVGTVVDELQTAKGVRVWRHAVDGEVVEVLRGRRALSDEVDVVLLRKESVY